jgi:hypothetical protein
MVASAEAITADSEKYVEQLLQLFTRFSLLVNQVRSLLVTSLCKVCGAASPALHAIQSSSQPGPVSCCDVTL